MSACPAIDLTSLQRAALEAVFSRFSDIVDVVGVYGSRVQAKARAGSDVDLVIYGQISPRDEAAIRSALEESDLSIFADVVVYETIGHPPLKAQIDHWMQPLFNKHDLTVARTAQAA